MTIRRRESSFKKTYPAIFNRLGEELLEPFTQVLHAGQITDSDSHQWPPPKGAIGNFGGPFRTRKVHYDIGTVGVKLERDRTGQPLFYNGPVSVPLVEAPNFFKLELPEPSGDLDAKGAIAISNCAPNNPHANVSTGLAELFKEGLPSLPGIQFWEKKTAFLKGLGSEYLNYEFGWKPLTEEVTEVSSAISQSAQLLEQYELDEGKAVRRRFNFPIENLSAIHQEFGNQRAYYGHGSQFDSERVEGTVSKDTTVSRRRWFSGSFTYATPNSSTSWSKVTGAGSQAENLLGTSLTPDTLWELTPWSWAIDWFSNTGSVINNVTLFDQLGLVMRYGYMMEETITTYAFTMDVAGLVGQERLSMPASVITDITKIRVPANPFGFGISWEGLSPTQLAITAALGITRLL
jgi:hypothetical protein